MRRVAAALGAAGGAASAAPGRLVCEAMAGTHAVDEGMLTNVLPTSGLGVTVQHRDPADDDNSHRHRHSKSQSCCRDRGPLPSIRDGHPQLGTHFPTEHFVRMKNGRRIYNLYFEIQEVSLSCPAYAFCRGRDDPGPPRNYPPPQTPKTRAVTGRQALRVFPASQHDASTPPKSARRLDSGRFGGEKAA